MKWEENMEKGEATKINQKGLTQKDLKEFIDESQRLRNEVHYKVYQLETMMKLVDVVAESQEALTTIDVIEVCNILKPIIAGVDEDLNELDSSLNSTSRAIEILLPGKL
jgi:hypothetical protein